MINDMIGGNVITKCFLDKVIQIGQVWDID